MDELEQSAETQNSEEVAANTATSVNDEVAENEEGGSQSSQEQGEEETDELDVDGEKFALPKSAAEKLKQRMMMHDDYTRKTQAAAEDRKAITAEREQFQKEVQAQQEFLSDRAKVIALDNQLAEYEKLDWNALVDQDPIAVQKLQLQRDQLLRAKAEAMQTITQKQQEYGLKEQQAIAKQVQEAEVFVQREISGWSEKRGEQLKEYAAKAGVSMSQDVAKTLIANPALFVIMDKAEKFDQLVNKQAAKKPVQTAPQAKPVPRLNGSNSGAQKDPANMTDREFADWRRKQISNRGK